MTSRPCPLFKGITNKDKNNIIGALRQAFKYSEIHKNAKRRARVEKHEGKFKNGRDKVRVYYQCAKCNGLFKSNYVDIDHIDPIGPFNGSFDSWIKRCFTAVESLQVLCKDCHKGKTNAEKRSSSKR